jgi:hypothetical protein
LETDYVEYRFLQSPQYTDFEKSVIVAETCGQPVPIAAKEELIRKASLEHIQDPEELQQGKKVSRPHSRDAIKEEKHGHHLHADEGWERKGEKMPAQPYGGMQQQGIPQQVVAQVQLLPPQQGFQQQQPSMGLGGSPSQERPGMGGSQLGGSQLGRDAMKEEEFAVPIQSGQQQLPPVSGAGQQGYQQQQPGLGGSQSQEREGLQMGQESALEKKAQMHEADELRGSGVQRDVSSV